MRKISKRLHLWLAIPAGVFITLICLTGAIMVFQTQIEEALHSDRYFCEVGAEPMELDSLVAVANGQLNSDSITALKVYSDPSRNIVAILSSGARVYAYINPSTAKVVEVTNARAGFFHNVMTLHRWLMLPNRAVGKMIMGVSTICFIFILITGLIRWIPRKRNITNGFVFKWRCATPFRKLLDLHKIFGAYSAILLLVMAFTGLMWSFDWYRGGVAKVLNVEVLGKKSNKPGITHNSNDIQCFWQLAFNQTAALNLDYQSVTISKSGDISLLLQSAPHQRAADKYRFNFKDRSVVLISKYDDGSSSHMMSQNYAIHVGTWGGVGTQILWFLASIVGALLPITGYILYYRCRADRKT